MYATAAQNFVLSVKSMTMIFPLHLHLGCHRHKVTDKRSLKCTQSTMTEVNYNSFMIYQFNKASLNF